MFGKYEVEVEQHRIADIRQRDQQGECWILCTCDELIEAGTVVDLEFAWRKHRSDMKMAKRTFSKMNKYSVEPKRKKFSVV